MRHSHSLLPAALLTQLHWSLPRPLSDAERQLSAELDVLTARQVGGWLWCGRQPCRRGVKGEENEAWSTRGMCVTQLWKHVLYGCR